MGSPGWEAGSGRKKPGPQLGPVTWDGDASQQEVAQAGAITWESQNQMRSPRELAQMKKRPWAECQQAPLALRRRGSTRRPVERRVLPQTPSEETVPRRVASCVTSWETLRRYRKKSVHAHTHACMCSERNGCKHKANMVKCQHWGSGGKICGNTLFCCNFFYIWNFFKITLKRKDDVSEAQ